MDNLQYKLSEFKCFFSTTGLRDLIKKMVEGGTTKIDLFNVDLEDVQNILSWHDFYFKVSELKHLKDTV